MDSNLKKILHIIVGLNVGGAELMLKRLVLQGQQDEIFSHEVVSITDLGNVGEDLREVGIQVYTLGMQSFSEVPNAIIQLRKLIKKVQPDIVQTWMYHADLIGGLAAKSLGIKKILWGIRTTDAKEGNSKLTPVVQKLCAKLSYIIPDQIICAAHISKDVHIKVGYDASKMIVIHNGYDLSALQANEQDRERKRHELLLDESDIVIGSVGRFNEAKNPKLFIKMAAILVKSYPTMKFMMVGRDNTASNNILVSWLKKENLMKNFLLLGQRSDIATCMKAMDVFCLHSRTEGFPNVLAEAMAVGTPAVSVDVGDAKYIIDGLGHVIPQNDAESLAKAVDNILSNILPYEDKLRNLQLASKQHIIEQFSIEKVYEKYRLIWLN